MRAELDLLSPYAFKKINALFKITASIQNPRSIEPGVFFTPRPLPHVAQIDFYARELLLVRSHAVSTRRPLHSPPSSSRRPNRAGAACFKELLALVDVVGAESRGLSADSIASLQSITYKAQSGQNGSNETCVIYRLDYEDGDNLTLLSCKHSYHSECINNWLKINKAHLVQYGAKMG